MPILRYFVGVGGVLLALLLIANVVLPKPAPLPQQGSGVDKSTIRITSTQKGPERVVIDTALPTIVPPVDVARTQIQPATGTTAQAAAPREAFAQMAEPAKPAAAPAVTPTPKKHKVRVARSDSQRRYAMQQQGYVQQGFGWQQPSRVAMVQRQPSIFGGLFGNW